MPDLLLAPDGTTIFATFLIVLGMLSLALRANNHETCCCSNPNLPGHHTETRCDFAVAPSGGAK